VSDANMKATVDVMVEYGGLETKAKDELKNYYTNAYLPDGS
jgi:NitT/TauT family transport system substrate-binding protein